MIESCANKNNFQLMNINFFSFIEILKNLIIHKEALRRFKVVAMSSVASIRGVSNAYIHTTTNGVLDSYVHSVSEELSNKIC